MNLLPDERKLHYALASLCRQIDPSLTSAVRKIRPTDDTHLTRAERDQLAKSALSVQQASGAARFAARSLLGQRDTPANWDILRGRSGAPIWPTGVIGSISHDEQFSAVTIGPIKTIRSIGLDIEAATPMLPELTDLVATSREQEEAEGNLLHLKILFCLKEAVYKAVNVIDQQFLDFKDVEVFWSARKAIVQGDRVVGLRWTSYPRIIALSYV